MEQPTFLNTDATDIAPKFSGYQIMVIILLALLQFTVVLDFMILAPLGPFLMQSLSITPKGFGLIVSSYAFSAGASGILAAGFADKFDRKRLLLFFYTGFIIGTLCCAMSATSGMLLAARIVTGLFGGVISAISMTIVTDLFAVQQRGRVMGYVQMALAGSQILGIPIGLLLANRWGWHAAFFMVVIMAALIALTILLKVKPIVQHLKVQSDSNPFLHLWHALSNRSYQTGFIATAFLSIGGFMLMPFGSAFLIDNIKINTNELSTVFLFTGIAAMVIMPVVGKLSDSIDKFLIFSVGTALAIVMILIYVNLTPVPLWEVIVLNMILFMGIMSRMIPATTLTMSIPDLKDRGAFMSVNASLQQMAGGIAALSAGLIVTQKGNGMPLEHYDTLGSVVSLTMVVGAFLLYRVSALVKSKQNLKTAVA